MIRFKANDAVRLQATSELLFIDAIDEESAIALCRRFGSFGPEGTAAPYPLDSLRENVIRASRAVDPRSGMSTIRRIICRSGLHDWKPRTFNDRPLLSEIAGKVCAQCGEIRLQG